MPSTDPGVWLPDYNSNAFEPMHTPKLVACVCTLESQKCPPTTEHCLTFPSNLLPGLPASTHLIKTVLGWVHGVSRVIDSISCPGVGDGTGGQRPGSLSLP